MLPFRDLQKRAKANDPIQVGIVGAGFLGSGVLYQILRTPGMRVPVIANRTPHKAVEALLAAGVKAADIRVCASAGEARSALDEGLTVVTPALSLLPHEFPEIDVVVETTGDVLFGTEVALRTIEAKKHFVASNPETQGTVGCILKRRAEAAGVVYSDADGDQGGILKRLYDYCAGIGFEPVVAGNCKGVMKRYATPETQAAYAKAYGIQPWIATAAADGTKLNFEMCIFANATGMLPAKPGMTGPETSLETLLRDFEEKGLLDRGPIIEYTMGIPVGVFIIALNRDARVRSEMNYFKMGDGPHYLFFHPRVLCQYDAVPGIAEAVLYGEEVISPGKTLVAEMATYAKRPLSSGQQLDGIGGFDCYGMVVDQKESAAGDFLPVGLSGYARLTRNLEKDEPLRVADIEWTEDNALIRLWKEQTELFSRRQIPTARAS
ncbi:MAG TPA: NAD(P)-dependent oxidoreductase [Verrucomicrobiae bacterium]|jgi:predicted homoserine dehydrogenase-like protein|nr:NAD(P)-dependent oxidoreductase [Verrucomicrobiae bacterium]